MSEVKQEMYDPFIDEWVPYDADKAATISIVSGELAVRTYLTAQEIIDKHSADLTEEQIDQLKSHKHGL